MDPSPLPPRPPVPDRALPAGQRALLLVDLQNGTCGPELAAQRPAFLERFQASTLPCLERALALARQHQIEVIHTVIANLTRDGRDRSLDYQRCGMGFAPGTRRRR